MIIRPAQAADAADICRISNDIIRHSLITFTTMDRSPEATRQVIEAGEGAFLVAVEGDTVLGFASYGEFRKGPGYAHTKELSIQLAPQARGRGLGRKLMAELESRARAADVHVLVAGISSANPESVTFHAALGFSEVARMPEVGRKQGQWLDLILMQKIL